MKPEPLHMLLGGAVVAASVALFVELGRPVPVFAPPPPEAPTVGPSPAAAMPPLSVAALEERPLFTADRRPPKPASIAAPVAVSPPPAPPPPPPLPEASTGLTLLGIVNAPQGRVAIIRMKARGEVVRAAEGATVDRWELKQILTDHVILAVDGTTQELGFPPPAERRAGPGAGRPTPQPVRPPAPRP